MTPPEPSILVTGAGGFVGTHLVAALAQALPEAALHTAYVDITDPDAVMRSLAAAAPTHIVHLAAIAAIGQAREDPTLAWRVNLDATLHLARAVRDRPAPCRLVFVSSADAYGGSFRDGGAAAETRRLEPLNTYGATKAAADLALGAMAAEGLDVVRLRAFNHTGPGQRDSFVVAAFARQIALIEAGRQPPVIKVGALAPERDFLDVRDVVRAYAGVIATPERVPPGTILNVASGIPRRIGDVLAALIAIAGIEVEVQTEHTRLRPTDIAHAVGDATRIHDMIGWSPAIAWNDTLADVLDDWRVRIRS